ncbi:putative duf821 domain-containing protein [Lasiodiplodia theobromae]|nr:putative duf821 domain-containing protein [Lasiodiplodia theobromae]
MVGPGAVRFPCYHTVDSQPPVSENVAGTTKVDFVPLFRDLDTSYGTFELYQNIGFQRPCQDYSLEELRLIDYAQSGAADVTSKQAASGSIENDKAGPGPRKVSSIESLPEELVTEIAQRLCSNDLKSLRLASRRLSKTTFYVFAQCIPSVHFVALTESGLRSFLPLSRNYDLAGRILTVNLLSPFIVTEDEDSDQEHVCYQDPRLADCPIRIQKNLVRGQSELHIRLLSEILGNLRILRRVRLRAFPVITSREPLEHALAAQYPMSSWAFYCVMAAVQRAANHLPELAFEEVELFSQAACSGKLTKPPPTDISPLAWELEPISGLESLDLRVESTEQLDGAIRHPSMFRYMRAILAAAAPGLESLSLTSSDCHQREVLNGILGDGMRMPKLKSLALTSSRVTFETLKAIAFPKLYTEINRAHDHFGPSSIKQDQVKIYRERKPWAHAQIHVLIHTGQLYIIDYMQGASNVARGYAGLSSLYRALIAVDDPTTIPNVEFILDIEDTPVLDAPADRIVWAWNRPMKNLNTWVAPDFDGWAVSSYISFRDRLRHIEEPFALKIPKAAWRGNINNGVREALMAVVNNTSSDGWADVATMKGHRLHMAEFCKYMFAIHTEGIAWSGRLRYLQNCESVAVNYIAVRNDFSDLEEKIKHYLARPALAERIAKTSAATFRDRYLTPAAEACYWRRMVRSWADCQAFKPEQYEDVHQADGTTIKDGFLYIDGGVELFKNPSEIILGYNQKLLRIDIKHPWDPEDNTTRYMCIYKPNNTPPSLVRGALYRGHPNDTKLYTYGGTLCLANTSFDTSATQMPETSTIWGYGTSAGTWSSHDIKYDAPWRPNRGSYAEAPALSPTFYLNGQLDAGSYQGTSLFGNATQYLDGMVIFNTAHSHTINVTTISLGRPRVAGGLVYIEGVGANGALIAAGGMQRPEAGSRDELKTLLGTVKPQAETYRLLDPTSAWWQLLLPIIQVITCTYMYGGIDVTGKSPVMFDDVYTLSLPSFTWTRTDVPGNKFRWGHTCHLTNSRQMLTVDGSLDSSVYDIETKAQQVNLSNIACAGHLDEMAVLDLTTLQWGSMFNLPEHSYEVPDAVVSRIGGNGMGGATMIYGTAECDNWAD